MATSSSPAPLQAADWIDVILTEPEWRQREEAHRGRVMPWIQPRLDRQSRHESHPVEDFLFEYYPIRPSQLLRWHPGPGVGLSGEGAAKFLSLRGYRQVGDLVSADPSGWPAQRRNGVEWIGRLLKQTAGRPGQFGCAGLHEWAMVYRATGLRHDQWPLRVTGEDIELTLKSQPVVCTHYDAFRFFTEASRPLNRFQPTRESQPLMEQPGCLHANMDLYKWAAKLMPFIRSELVADCFELAREIRELDMRASPYDLSALGFQPVRIETKEGRAEYETAQRAFARRAAPLRSAIADTCEKILQLTAPGSPVQA